MDPAQGLLFSAVVILLGNFRRAPTHDRSVVAIAAFFGLFLFVFTQLPYHGWYVLSMIGLVVSYMAILYAAVFFVVTPGLVLPAGKDACWSAIPDKHRASLATSLWTVNISLIWMVVQWAKSLPADTNVPAIIARIICPVMHWPDHMGFDDGPDSPGFRPVPESLLLLESMTGFAILFGAMAYGFYHHRQRRKIVTPVPASYIYANDIEAV